MYRCRPGCGVQRPGVAHTQGESQAKPVIELHSHFSVLFSVRLSNPPCKLRHAYTARASQGGVMLQAYSSWVEHGGTSHLHQVHGDRLFSYLQ